MKCRRKSLIDWLYKNVLQCFDWLIVEPFSWEFTKTNREGERTIGCLRKLKMYRLIDCWTLSWRFVLIWGSIFSRLHPASREEGRGDYHHHHTHGASSSPETTDSGNIIERRHSRCARRKGFCSVVDQDPNWICMQELCLSGSLFQIQIWVRIHIDEKGQKEYDG